MKGRSGARGIRPIMAHLVLNAHEVLPFQAGIFPPTLLTLKKESFQGFGSDALLPVMKSENIGIAS